MRGTGNGTATKSTSRTSRIFHCKNRKYQITCMHRLLSSLISSCGVVGTGGVQQQTTLKKEKKITINFLNCSHNCSFQPRAKPRKSKQKMEFSNRKSRDRGDKDLSCTDIWFKKSFLSAKISRINLNFKWALNKSEN